MIFKSQTRHLTQRAADWRYAPPNLHYLSLIFYPLSERSLIPPPTANANRWAVEQSKYMQKFYDTAGYLYAVRFWRLVVHVDNQHPSLRFGGVVTSIGLARFLFWRFSFVG